MGPVRDGASLVTPASLEWLTMHEAMELGVTYRQLQELVIRGDVVTRTSGRVTLFNRGSLVRCLAADGASLPPVA